MDSEGKDIIWKMPFNTIKDKVAEKYIITEKSGMQFSNIMTEQIGGQLKAGFTLPNIYEDTNGFGRLHEQNIKTCITTKSVKLLKQTNLNLIIKVMSHSVS